MQHLNFPASSLLNVLAASAYKTSANFHQMYQFTFKNWQLSPLTKSLVENSGIADGSGSATRHCTVSWQVIEAKVV